MRKGVPFFAEEQLVRQEGTRDSGRLPEREISEILSTQSGTSSWEDLVEGPSRVRKPTHEMRRLVPIKPTPGRPGLMNRLSGAMTTRSTHIEWMPIRHGHCLRINVNGNMDLEMRKEWRRLMRAMTKNNVGQFEFNLIQTANISLSGLGMLLLFRELKKAQRTDIKLCHCNKQIRDMLQLTGMDKYFLIQARVSGDEEEA
jgi:anti-anti-sigma factor